MKLAREALLIRADVNAQMGTGHLMRCLARGEQRPGRSAVFLTARDSDRGTMTHDVR